MKIPLSWLNEYIKIDDIDPKELAEKLTRAGLQVETVETVGGVPLADDFVVVEVLESVPHPDSDHLHVCKVTDGANEYQVVCGAPNMRTGIKTAFAKIGAVIPEGGFKIKKGKLRGVESFGMCCSYRELGLEGGSDGIIEFPAETPVGAFVRDAVCAEKPETVFEIEVTWNRPDALSVLGIAREYSAILGREIKLPAVDFTECDRKVEDEVKVVVEDAVKCPRYTARVVTEVEDGPSPDLMAKRLELCGVRSLGLVVDVTNYVMLELGQPMHAFDHTKLKDRTIVVRTARDGETMKTLDGVERKLDGSMLVICDAERPNAVAGVMGGAESEIAAGTKTVLLESALFQPESTKYTATKLGLATESSYRYIRGVDKDLADFASRRAAHLLQKYGKAKIAAGVVDADSRPRPFNAPVALDFERARRLIGIPVGNDAMVYILKRLGLVPVVAGDHFAGVEQVSFEVPSWRYDISMEADLVEEIARLYGLDNIPDTMPSAPSVSALSDAPFRARERMRELLCALGFSEAMHYSFLSAGELKVYGFKDVLAIPDPVSAEYGVMRPSLIPQMAATLGRNAARGEERTLLFEMGKVFLPGPAEEERLCIGFVGPVGRETLRSRAALGEEEAVLWMKGVLEEFVAKLHAGRLEFAPAEREAFAPGATLAVKLNGREIGILGAAGKALKHPYRLSTQLVLCEIKVDVLTKNVDRLGKVSVAPQFPAVVRDISFKARKGVTHDEIVKLFKKNGGKELVKVELFDEFKDSRAYSLTFRSAERTLTDDEVGRTFQRIVDAVKEISQ